MKKVGTIQRYKAGTRINHWFVAGMFLCAGLSGLAMFSAYFFVFTGLFGGGQWTRILHPYFGLLMAAGFVILFFQVWKANFWKKHDTAWVKQSGDMLAGRMDRLPPVGKYNPGQKGVFWLFVVTLAILLVTGFMFWRPWFTSYFPIPVQRIAIVLHSASAVVLILGVIVHIYAAIWIKGSVGAMTRGKVGEHWAREHHPLWYREVKGQARE